MPKLKKGDPSFFYVLLPKGAKLFFSWEKIMLLYNILGITEVSETQLCSFKCLTLSFLNSWISVFSLIKGNKIVIKVYRCQIIMCIPENYTVINYFYPQ